MTHQTLYTPFIAPCVCCGIAREFTLTSPTDTIQCPACKHHGLEADSRRGKDDYAHKQMWAFEYSRAVAERDARIVALSTQVSELAARIKEQETKLEARFEDLQADEIEKYYENKFVAEAREQASAAGYARDKAMRVLLHIDGQHHFEPSTGGCVCGRRSDSCPTDAALERQRDHIYKWRQREIEAGWNPDDFDD